MKIQQQWYRGDKGKVGICLVRKKILYIYFFGLFRATPMACGGSQARGLIGAVAAGLHQSHSNAGPEPCLQPTPQLTATLDPRPN